MVALDDHWIGDLLGGIALLVIFVVGIFAVAAFQ
jgi:hypothetical protein